MVKTTARLDEVENYAALGGTDLEIAEMVGCSPQTLKRRYGEKLKAGRARRRLRLRQKQTEVALGGNVTMLIWLGKQELGQVDRQELTGKGGQQLVQPNINVRLTRPSE
jgi:hypothetical protein